MSSEQVKSRKPKAKQCIYGTCKNNSLNPLDGVYYVPFPKPTTPIATERAKRWIALCRWQDATLESINRNTYVCSQHFIDPRGPTDLNPDPIPATSAMAMCNRKPPKRLNYNAKKLKSMWERSKFLLKRATLTRQGAGKREAAEECPLRITSTSTIARTDFNKLHRQTNKVPAAQRNIDSIAPLEPFPNVSTPEPIPSTASEPTVQTTLRAEAWTQTVEQEETKECLLKTCTELYKAVGKNCSNWLVRCDILRAGFRARIVKLQDSRESMTVIVTYCRKKFDVSVYIYQFLLEKSHSFWSDALLPTDIGEVVRLIHDLSQWKICTVLCSKSGANSDGEMKTNCMLLCEFPSLMCDACKADTVSQMNDAGKVISKVSLMTMQHSHMSERELRAKLKMLRNELHGAMRQNERRRAKLYDVTMQLDLFKRFRR